MLFRIICILTILSVSRIRMPDLPENAIIELRDIIRNHISLELYASLSDSDILSIAEFLLGTMADALKMRCRVE